MLFANVIVDISHEKLDRPFGYIIPNELVNVIHIGSAVNSHWKGNRLISGFVIEITNHSDFPVERMKKIACIESGSESATSRLCIGGFHQKIMVQL